MPAPSLDLAAIAVDRTSLLLTELQSIRRAPQGCRDRARIFTSCRIYSRTVDE
jgi:hypothetical protein